MADPDRVEDTKDMDDTSSSSAAQRSAAVEGAPGKLKAKVRSLPDRGSWVRPASIIWEEGGRQVGSRWEAGGRQVGGRWEAKQEGWGKGPDEWGQAAGGREGPGGCS